MNSESLRVAVEPILNDIFDGLYDAPDSEWDKIFSVKKASAYRYQEEVSIFGLGLAAEKAEGAAYLEDQGGESYRVRYLHRAYALGFSLTQELVEDGEHIDVGSTYSEHLGRSMAETKEWVHAGVFNNAFNPNAPGGDRVALLSTQHRLYGMAPGTVASNTLATQADLSEMALEVMRSQIMLTTDDRGKRATIKPEKLIVHPDNMPNAYRILKSERRVGTANNDANFLRQTGFFKSEPMELTRLINNRAWFIQTNAPRGLQHFWKRKIKRGMEGDFKTDTMKYKSSERYSCGWTDWRCLFGSSGG